MIIQTHFNVLFYLENKASDFDIFRRRESSQMNNFQLKPKIELFRHNLGVPILGNKVNNSSNQGYRAKYFSNANVLASHSPDSLMYDKNSCLFSNKSKQLNISGF